MALTRDQTKHLKARSERTSKALDKHRARVRQMVQSVTVQASAVTIRLEPASVAQALGLTNFNPAASIQFVVPAQIKRSGHAVRIVLESGCSPAPSDSTNLITLVARAHSWWAALCERPERTLTQFARSQGVTRSYAARVLRLAFLDPKIAEAIVGGRAPLHIDIARLTSPM